MSRAAVRTAIRAELASSYAGRWEIVDTVNGSRRTVSGRREYPAQWVTAHFYAAEEQLESVNGADGVWTETGTVILYLFDEAGTGEDAIVAEADYLARIFRRWRGLTGTLRIDRVDPVDLAGGEDRGRWLEGTVQLFYTYHFAHVPLADEPRALAGDEAGNFRGLAGDEAGNTRITARA